LEKLSISVVVAPLSDVDGAGVFLKSLSEQSRLPDEVILVDSVTDAALSEFCARRGIGFVFRKSSGSFTRRVNVGLSFARFQVVFVFKGCESFGSSLYEDILLSFSRSALGVVLLRNPARMPADDVLVARRDCFLYGALDERFGDSSLSIPHWFEAIFKGAKRRFARFDACSVVERRDLLSRGYKGQNTLKGLALGWRMLPPGLRLRTLLSGVKTASPGEIRDAVKAILGKITARRSSPYASWGTPYREKAFWETNTKDYVKWEVFQPDEEEILEILEVTRPETILEIGCGAGRNFRYFPSGARCFGLDISLNLLRRAREKQNILGMVCGSATHLCFPGNAFDLVFADSTIQHVPPEKVGSCITDLVRVARRYICLIEYTREENEHSRFFSQPHCFMHDYASLFGGRMRLVLKKEVSYRVQPAIKEVFLFEKSSP